MRELWPSLLFSLQISLLATLLTGLVGVPLAFWMARARFTGKSVYEAVILIPLVLPPTVVGYFIIVLFGTRGWVGSWINRAFDYSIVFRPEGAILAAAIVALPMLYIPAKAAFAGVERELEDIARLYGATRLQLFWHVSLPLAARGLFSGFVLAFARALGEFGATMMVFGLQPDRSTLPISIYLDYEAGHLEHAGPAVCSLTAISLVLIVAYNRSPLGRQQ